MKNKVHFRCILQEKDLTVYVRSISFMQNLMYKRNMVKDAGSMPFSYLRWKSQMPQTGQVFAGFLLIL